MCVGVRVLVAWWLVFWASSRVAVLFLAFSLAQLTFHCNDHAVRLPIEDTFLHEETKVDADPIPFATAQNPLMKTLSFLASVVEVRCKHTETDTDTDTHTDTHTHTQTRLFGCTGPTPPCFSCVVLPSPSAQPSVAAEAARAAMLRLGDRHTPTPKRASAISASASASSAVMARGSSSSSGGGGSGASDVRLAPQTLQLLKSTLIPAHKTAAGAAMDTSDDDDDDDVDDDGDGDQREAEAMEAKGNGDASTAPHSSTKQSSAADGGAPNTKTTTAAAAAAAAAATSTTSPSAKRKRDKAKPRRGPWEWSDEEQQELSALVSDEDIQEASHAALNAAADKAQVRPRAMCACVCVVVCV